MPAEGRENPLLKKGNFDAFFREKYLTKNNLTSPWISRGRPHWLRRLTAEQEKAASTLGL